MVSWVESDSVPLPVTGVGRIAGKRFSHVHTYGSASLALRVSDPKDSFDHSDHMQNHREGGQGQIALRPQVPRGLITPNATRLEEPHEVN